MSMNGNKVEINGTEAKERRPVKTSPPRKTFVSHQYLLHWLTRDTIYEPCKSAANVKADTKDLSAGSKDDKSKDNDSMDIDSGDVESKDIESKPVSKNFGNSEIPAFILPEVVPYLPLSPAHKLRYYSVITEIWMMVPKVMYPQAPKAKIKPIRRNRQYRKVAKRHYKQKRVDYQFRRCGAIRGFAERLKRVSEQVYESMGEYMREHEVEFREGEDEWKRDLEERTCTHLAKSTIHPLLNIPYR